MIRNAGNIDRALRAIVGLAAISLVFIGPQTPWGWLGLVPLAAAITGRCPAFALFGAKTCSAKDNPDGDQA